MGFEHATAFWWLLALLLLVLFNFWRQLPERHGVSSVILWRLIADRVPPVRAARRPRISASLLLQALAIAAMIGSLADPFGLGSGRPPRRVAIVVDTSARMNARLGDGRTRFDAARESVLREISKLRSDDRGVLHWADESPHRWEGDARELAARLRAIEATHHAVPLAPLIEQARRGGGELWIVSDRASGVGDALEFLEGEPGDNAGITEFSIEENEAFARIECAGNPRDVVLVLSADGEELARETVRAPCSWSRKFDPGKRRRVTLSFEGGDQLLLDNVAAATRFRGEAAVALAGREHPLLSRVIASVPDVVVRRGGTSPITVLHQTLAPVPAEGLVVYVDPPAAPEGFRFGERWAPKIFALSDHPLAREIRPSELSSASAREIVEGGVPVLSADGRTVAAVRKEGALTRVVLAFELAGWTGGPSFPIFWTNVVDFARTAGGWRVVRAGRTEVLPEDVIAVVADRKARFEFDRSSGRLLAGTVGEYRAKTAEGDLLFDAGLLDPRETDTEGVTLARAPADSGPREPVKTPLAAWGCAVALVLVAAAWWTERKKH